MSQNKTTDLTKGVYRKIYGGFLRGKRINKVSFEAQLLFFRLHAIADDFGNMDAECLAVDAFPRGRRVDDDEAEAWAGELVEAELVRAYEVDGNAYLHIYDFVELQPAGKNGTRIKRVPEPPECIPVNPDESEGIPMGPGRSSESVAPEYEYEDDNHNEDETEDETETEVQSESEQAEAVGGGLSLDRCAGEPAGGSGSGLKFSLPDSDSGSGQLDRRKGEARWQATAVALVGLSHGSRHPPQSKQYASDVTCVRRIFDSVWPEDRVEKPPGLERLLELAAESKSRKTPLAWLQSMLKKEGLLAG